MSNRKVITIIITMVLSSTMVINSCKNSKSTVTPTVSFTKDIIPILTTSCALNTQCHSGTTNAGLNLDLDSSVAYVSITTNKDHLLLGSSPTATLLYTEVESGEMPKPPNSPLSANQISLILNWIKQGALNN